MIALVVVGLLILLALSVPIGIVLILLGIGIDIFATPMPLIRALGRVVWSSSNSATLIAIPFFILLGEILVRSGVAGRTYAALQTWLSWLPGGLIHANIGTATMFSATSGSSVATAATVATVAMPQGDRLGYDPRLFAGAIAAGGTLGIIIPPSINLIIYGVLTQTSIPRLFLAGLLPGLLMALGFMIVVAILCWLRPSLGGTTRHFTWRERLTSLIDLVPILLLFTVVVGSIYGGFATPTEAAAVGVAMSFVIALFQGSVSLTMLTQALTGTVRLTAMIMLVIIGAYFLNFALASAGLGQQLTQMLAATGLSPFQVLLLVIGIYFVLGFFIETLSLMVLTIPIVVPILVNLGYDPVWLGILLIVLIEMALITPPVGLNLFVVQGVRASGSLNEVMLGAIPFVLVMMVMVGMLLLFPQIALFLPSQM
jgi:C4-dicarboxylate transporter DctM subunit